MKKQGIITALLVVLIALLGVNQYLLATAIPASKEKNQPIAPTGLATSRQPAVVSGELTSYGITKDNNGFKALLNAEKISLSGDAGARYQRLINEIPHDCCPGNVQGFAPIGGCDCGHAQALRGLAKLLIQKGWSDNDIKSEADNWRRLFFSEGSQVGSMGGC